MSLRTGPCRCAWAAGLIAGVVFLSSAQGFIDPDRPISWLVGECRAIAALKVTAVERGSATFAVTKVLQGELKPKEITIRWTATQQPPVDKQAVGAPAVLLEPKDAEDPTLLQVSPEYLSLKPDANKPGQYEFVRLNGFVKGSFNGEAGDLIDLIQDTLGKRAYFPIWADTAFAPARKIGDLPDAASALAVGDLDGDGKLDIVAATPGGLIAFSPAGDGKFAPHPLTGAGGTGVSPASSTAPTAGAAVPQTPLQLADLDGDGKLDILTGSGLFVNKGNWRFAGLHGAAGRSWSAACFCFVPGQRMPEVIAVESGRARHLALAPHAPGALGDLYSELPIGKAPDGVVGVSACTVGDRVAVLLATSDALAVHEASTDKLLRPVQSLKLTEEGKPGLKNLHLIQRDLDGDGLADVFLVHDGGARFFRRQADGTLNEIPDYLGDVRKMFQPVEGCAGLMCADFNNDGLPDLLAWSKSVPLLLVMNRGYHNLREGTEIFDLPAALKGLGEVQSVAAADIDIDGDGDGDLDLIVAAGKGLYLLANTFETKPEEANDRPRNPLLTVRAPGKFGALVAIEDKDSKPLASQRIGEGPAADTVYFGYRGPAPAAVVLTTTDGAVIRQKTAPESPGKPILFK